MKTNLSLLLLTALSLAAQDRGQLDHSPSLFAVLTAIHAAGYNQDLASPSNHEIRAKVVEYVKSKNPPSLAEIKKFYASKPNVELGHYISYALTLDGPPSFKMSKKLKDPPPDAIILEAMSPLLAAFWAEAGLDDVWRQVQPAYEQVIAKSFHDPVSREILKVNSFLRNPTSGASGRNFQIFVELMAPPHQVHQRSFGDDFFVVVTPSPEPQIAEIRRAYLYYLLDPLSLRFAQQVKEKDGLLQFAQPAPALEPYYKEDFALLATASLVRAVDARLTPGSGSARLELVDQWLREGFILTPYFYEHLPLYEKQERAMRLYYPDMIQAIDLRKEDKRLENVQWAEKKVSKKFTVTTEVKPTGVLKTLEDAEDLYNQKQYPKAKQKFSDVLRETDSRPLHAKAYFGLARVSALDREFELSIKLFEKALELNPDSHVKAWSLIFLGRMHYAVNELEPAVEKYQAALAVEGAPKAARDAATRGLEEANRKLKQ